MTNGGTTRRRFLAAGAQAAMASALPASIARAAAIPADVRSGTIADVAHVVILMQENRSFDHYFGTLKGVRGFGDPLTVPLPGGRSVFAQEAADGRLVAPFHLSTKEHFELMRVASTPHSWPDAQAAWDQGRMQRWAAAKTDRAMGYFTREDMEFQFALAESFTLCDNYHCSVMGPTWPNRMYWMTGMIDPDATGGGPMISNTATPNGYTWKTYPERLEEAGVPWKVYQMENNYGCNMLENFAVFQNAARRSPLFLKGVAYGSEGEFEYDAINDKLPAVSWVICTDYQSEHPDYMPADGAAFVASKIDAIAANPDVWAKTLFILNYDENDGIFDHVVPPTPPAGTAHEFIGGLPIGAGFRVPCILISPWTTGGWVSSEPFDHTSTLRFLEQFTGVREPNITDWRRSTFGDLTSALRLKQAPGKPPVLPDTSGALQRAMYETKKLPRPKLPGADQKPPQQEKKRSQA